MSPPTLQKLIATLLTCACMISASILFGMGYLVASDNIRGIGMTFQPRSELFFDAASGLFYATIFFYVLTVVFAGWALGLWHRLLKFFSNEVPPPLPDRPL